MRNLILTSIAALSIFGIAGSASAATSADYMTGIELRAIADTTTKALEFRGPATLVWNNPNGASGKVVVLPVVATSQVGCKFLTITTATAEQRLFVDHAEFCPSSNGSMERTL